LLPSRIAVVEVREQFDYYTIHPDRLKSIIATMGIEHMGGRQTVEVGPDGNQYAYSTERPENGGCSQQ